MHPWQCCVNSCLQNIKGVKNHSYFPSPSYMSLLVPRSGVWEYLMLLKEIFFSPKYRVHLTTCILYGFDYKFSFIYQVGLKYNVVTVWEELMLFNYGAGEDSWESLRQQGDPSSSSLRKSVWKDWCWRWNFNTLATWCEELTHLKRPWCWERLKAGGQGVIEGEMVGWCHWLNGHEFE